MRPRQESVHGERLRWAAFRLKHDLGKSIRWNAPARREEDAEKLRRRLAIDLLQTRMGPEGAVGAVEVFEAWKKEEGDLFLDREAWGTRLARLTESIETIRRGIGVLSELSSQELASLDQATRIIQEETGALYRDVLDWLRSSQTES